MFENLTQKLETALKKVRGQGKLTEKNISDTLREIRRILLDADVNYSVAKDFIDKVTKKALGTEVISSVSPGQLITKIIYDELVDLLGGEQKEIRLNGSGITTILVVGLQGSGKTTFCGKLAKKLKDGNNKVILAAADVYRPAAIDQLKTLGTQIDVPVFSLDVQDAARTAREALAFAKEKNFNILIVDTAGRLHVDEQMMNEAAEIKEIIQPNESLFVVDAMTGQDAVNSAKAFNEKINYDGIVLTKLDGDARGGAALSIRSVVGKPIKFISSGEKLDAIDTFYPDRLASRILGQGDVISLVEKAQAAYDDDEADKLEEKFRKNKFDFEDFLKQIKMIKKMGSLSSLLGMIPGIGSQIKNANIDDNALVKVESIINSMTREERQKPKVLNGSRRKRIARGSGTTIQDVNRLIKQFNDMQSLMKKINQKGISSSFLNNMKLK